VRFNQGNLTKIALLGIDRGARTMPFESSWDVGNH